MTIGRFCCTLCYMDESTLSAISRLQERCRKLERQVAELDANQESLLLAIEAQMPVNQKLVAIVQRLATPHPRGRG